MEVRISGNYWKIGSEASIRKIESVERIRRKDQGKRLNDRITIIDLKIGSAE